MSEVLASYNRIRHLDLAERFYKKLLAADKRIEQAFAHTDFEQQRKLFTHGLWMLLQFGEDKTVGKMAIRRLAETHGHKGMKLPHDLYPIWIRCLVATVGELDPEFSPLLAKKWVTNMQKGILAMTGGHDHQAQATMA